MDGECVDDSGVVRDEVTTTGVVSVVSVAGSVENGGNLGEDVEVGGGGGGGGEAAGSSTNLVITK